jgi:hypothetical protein
MGRRNWGVHDRGCEGTRTGCPGLVGSALGGGDDGPAGGTPNSAENLVGDHLHLPKGLTGGSKSIWPTPMRMFCERCCLQRISGSGRGLTG